MTVIKWFIKLSLQFKDLLQHMIDTTVEYGSDSKVRDIMDDEEISDHSIIFMLAGYETTSNALACLSYLLALHPDIQEKLQVEIDNYYDNNPVSVLKKLHLILIVLVSCSFVIQDAPPYQASVDLQYLDMVIQESLRLYPPAPE